MIAGLPFASWVLLIAAVGLGVGIQFTAWMTHRTSAPPTTSPEERSQ